MLRFIEGMTYDATDEDTYGAEISGVGTHFDDYPDEDIGDWSTTFQGLINTGAQIYKQREERKNQQRARSRGWEFQPTPMPPQINTPTWGPNPSAPSKGSGVNTNTLLIGGLGLVAVMMVLKR